VASNSPTTDPLSRSLTPRELASRWRCRVTVVRGLIRAGTMPAIRIGGRIRITPEAIRRAESGPLAVRPVGKRRRESIPPEIVKLLSENT
jgi:excisionase family DNA binding protein